MPKSFYELEEAARVPGVSVGPQDAEQDAGSPHRPRREDETSTSRWSPGEPLKRMGADRDVFVVGRRVVACLLDCCLAALLSSVTFSPLLFVRPSLVVVLVLVLLFLLVFCAVFLVHAAVLDGYKGQTFGKALLGVEVIREQSGAPPGPYRAALRALTFLFVDMLVGLFVMLASPKRQRPGDVAAGTLVVRKKRR